jgi:hypothetical protein
VEESGGEAIIGDEDEDQAVGIDRRLFCRSTVGDEHLREDHEAMELDS